MSRLDSNILADFTARRARQIVLGLLRDFGETPEVLDELAVYLPERCPIRASVVEELARMATLGRRTRPVMVEA